MTNDLSAPRRFGRKARVLFLCGGNSARSQMAEAFARAAAPDTVEAFSAGVSPRPIHPLTMKTMAELKLNLSGQRSKSIEELGATDFDFIITLCDRATEECPAWPGVEKIVWSFDDPSAATGSETAQMVVFRRVALAIKQRISLFLLSTRLSRAIG